MKKLVLTLIAAIASVFAVNADPLGVKVGADIYANTLFTTAAYQANPYASYTNSSLGLDLNLKAGLWTTLTPTFNLSDKVQIDLTAGKSFKITDSFSLAPSLMVRNEFVTTATTGYALHVRPGVAGTYGISTTLVQIQSYLPVGLKTDLDALVYLDESVAIGDLGLGGYLYYNFIPSSAAGISEAGVYASYPLGPVGLGLTADFYGFKSTLDMSLIFTVTYSF